MARQIDTMLIIYPLTLKTPRPPLETLDPPSGSQLTLMVPLSRGFQSGRSVAGVEATQEIYHDYNENGKNGCGHGIL